MQNLSEKKALVAELHKILKSNEDHMDCAEFNSKHPPYDGLCGKKY